MMRRPPRRAGYFMRQRLRFADWQGNRCEPFWTNDMLVELTRQEVREEQGQYGPVGTRYRSMSGPDAHRWVREGRLHGTGLYIDCDNRVRYAVGECVD